MSNALAYLCELIAAGVEYPDAEYKAAGKFQVPAYELRADYDRECAAPCVSPEVMTMRERVRAAGAGSADSDNNPMRGVVIKQHGQPDRIELVHRDECLVPGGDVAAALRQAFGVGAEVDPFPLVPIRTSDGRYWDATTIDGVRYALEDKPL